MIDKKRLQEVRTFNVQLICDCGGEYSWNGHSLDQFPPLLPHVCSDCGHIETIQGESYPGTVTLPVGEPQDVDYE